MGFTELIANKISSAIASALQYDEDKREVIAYGAFTMLHSIWSYLVIILLGLVFRVFVPLCVIAVTSAFLRKYSGGAHCSSPNRCTFGGAFIFLILAFFVEIQIYFFNIYIYSLYLVICLATSLGIMVRYCPVDSPNKPIIRLESKRRLRRGSLVFISCCVIIMYVLTFIDIGFSPITAHTIALSIGTGLLWQSFTLTSVGHSFTRWYDCVLIKIIK